MNKIVRCGSAFVLALLMLCALVGCDNAEDLRKELNEYHFKGLTFYLGDGYELVYEGDSCAVYLSNGSDVEIEKIDLSSVDGDWGEIIDRDISSSEDLANAVKDYESNSSTSQNVKVESKHGIHYVWTEGAEEAAGEAMVIGCYVKDNDAWLMYVEIPNYGDASDDEIDTFIDYATLGVID